MLIAINRLFTFNDLVAHYGGPLSLWEKLRPLIPVWRVNEGIAIYLESEVDQFLQSILTTSDTEGGRSSKQTESPAVAGSADQTGSRRAGRQPGFPSDELTTQQAAVYLSVSVDTLEKYVKSGLLARRDIAPPGSAKPRYRYRVADLDRLKGQGYRKPTPRHDSKHKGRGPKGGPRTYDHLDL
jgi:hypothetical protein